MPWILWYWYMMLTFYALNSLILIYDGNLLCPEFLNSLILIYDVNLLCPEFFDIEHISMCLRDVFIPIYKDGDSWVLFLLLLCSPMMCTNNQVHYGLMVVLIHLHITLPHYHHYADISEGIELKKCLPGTVDSRYLAPVGSQNSRARVKWFSRYLALSREGHDSRIQDHRPTHSQAFTTRKQYVER